jgi:hypothetical protein
MRSTSKGAEFLRAVVRLTMGMVAGWFICGLAWTPYMWYSRRVIYAPKLGVGSAFLDTVFAFASIMMGYLVMRAILRRAMTARTTVAFVLSSLFLTFLIGMNYAY